MGTASLPVRNEKRVEQDGYALGVCHHVPDPPILVSSALGDTMKVSYLRDEQEVRDEEVPNALAVAVLLVHLVPVREAVPGPKLLDGQASQACQPVRPNSALPKPPLDLGDEGTAAEVPCDRQLCVEAVTALIALASGLRIIGPRAQKRAHRARHDSPTLQGALQEHTSRALQDGNSKSKNMTTSLTCICCRYNKLVRPSGEVWRSPSHPPTGFVVSEWDKNDLRPPAEAGTARATADERVNTQTYGRPTPVCSQTYVRSVYTGFGPHLLGSAPGRAGDSGVGGVVRCELKPDAARRGDVRVRGRAERKIGVS